METAILLKQVHAQKGPRYLATVCKAHLQLHSCLKTVTWPELKALIVHKETKHSYSVCPHRKMAPGPPLWCNATGLYWWVCGGEHAVSLWRALPPPDRGRAGSFPMWDGGVRACSLHPPGSFHCAVNFFFLMQPAPFIIEHPEVSGSTCSYLKAGLLSSHQHTENRPQPFLPGSHWVQLSRNLSGGATRCQVLKMHCWSDKFSPAPAGPGRGDR